MRGIGLMTLAIFIVTLMDAMAKNLMRTEPLGLVVFGRYAFALLGMLLLAGAMRAAVWRTAAPRLQLLRGLLLLTVSGLMFLSLGLLPLAETYAITFLAPLIVAALAPLLLGERVRLDHWIAILIGFVGVLVVIRPGLGGIGWTALLPAGMALASALFQIVTRRVAVQDPAMVSLFWTMIVGTIGSACLLPALGGWPSAWVLAQLAGVGLLGLLSQLAVIRAFSLAPASILSPFVYSQIVWAVPLGWLSFGDVPDGLTLVGAGIVCLGGLWLLQREHGKKH